MNLFKRVLIYCLGLLFIASGVTFSIKSNLGISPVNSLPYVLSLITGISQGQLIIIIFSIFILLQIIILRKDFQYKNLFQLVFSTLFGYFVTFTNFIILVPDPTLYIFKLIYLFISMVLIAIGIILYLKADLVPMPPEGCMLAIQQKSQISFHKIKITFDTTSVVLATSLSLIFLGELLGIREGTIIAALGIGKIIGFINKHFHVHLEKLHNFMHDVEDQIV